MKNYLEFEKEIKALEQEVDSLKSPFGSEWERGKDHPSSLHAE